MARAHLDKRAQRLNFKLKQRARLSDVRGSGFFTPQKFSRMITLLRIIARMIRVTELTQTLYNYACHILISSAGWHALSHHISPATLSEASSLY
jgi:hypothetical protein